MQLSPAQLKVYLVVTHAIQRDRNGGLLAISQIAKRADLSEHHARKAVEFLCDGRLLIRVNRVTGAELTNKSEWNGRTVKYANPIQWKQKDTSNPAPTGQRSHPEDEERNALRNGVTESQASNSEPAPAGQGNLTPVGQRYLRPVGQRHLESSELESSDLNASLQVHHHQETLENALAQNALVPETSLNQTVKRTSAPSNGSAGLNPLKAQRPDDDEKPPNTPAKPVEPKAEFLARTAQRHPEIDGRACFDDVQSELRKGHVPFEAYLRRDLLCTTNPKALTNPRGYYRDLAKKMVAERGVQRQWLCP